MHTILTLVRTRSLSGVAQSINFISILKRNGTHGHSHLMFLTSSIQCIESEFVPLLMTLAWPPSGNPFRKTWQCSERGGLTSATSGLSQHFEQQRLNEDIGESQQITLDTLSQAEPKSPQRKKKKGRAGSATNS